MPLERLFEGRGLMSKVGLYPFTSENLIRIGLALCVYLRLHRNIERPILAIEELSFITMAMGVGFMVGGGDLHVGGEAGDVRIKVVAEGDKARLSIIGVEDYELIMVESILFSRYNMPRAEGEEIGKVWIQGRKL